MLHFGGVFDLLANSNHLCYPSSTLRWQIEELVCKPVLEGYWIRGVGGGVEFKYRQPAILNQFFAPFKFKARGCCINFPLFIRLAIFFHNKPQHFVLAVDAPC